MRTIILVVLMHLMQHLQAQPSVHLSEQGLQGKVKMLRETEFQINEFYGRQSESRRYSSIYDTLGNKVSENYSDASGATIHKSTFLYNTNNQLSKELLFDTGNTPREVLLFHYKPQLVQMKVGEELKIAYVLQADNRLKQQTIFDQGQPVSITYFEYGGAKKPTEIREVGADGVLKYHHKLVYNEKDQLVERIELDQSSVPVFKAKFTYNTSGHLSEEKSSYINSTEQIKINYIYRYDAKGNWVEMNESMNGKKYAVTIRRITYHH